MKKIIITLFILIGAIAISPKVVQAETFQEGEFIPNIWMIRKNNQKLIYQSARFIRRASDGQFAYCIEPFEFIHTDYPYQSTIDPINISQEVWDQVNLIAYYGYGYHNHDSNKWYPITQIMIWKAIDSQSDFYFTDSLNGNKIDIYKEEINEIESLVAQHKRKPSFDQQTFEVVLGHTLSISDKNQVLPYYQLTSSDPNISIENDKITITGDFTDPKEFHLIRKNDLYPTPPILYYQSQSQNLMTVGTPNTLSASFSVKPLKTELIIHKIDKDTKNSISQGEAQLEGAIYAIYDDNETEIQTITIGKDKKVSIKNLDFGTYYLQEKSPGIGYLLNKEKIKLEVTKENPTITIKVENEVIKKKLEIWKQYGSGQPETEIQFEIYRPDGKYVTTMITDQKGYASSILPYGTYLIKQVNTTPGYEKIEDFKVTVDENSETTLTYHLTDLEIPVPNTGKTMDPFSISSISLLTGYLLYETFKKFSVWNIRL